MEIEGPVELLTHEDLHEQVIHRGVLQATRTVWIATGNLKDMHIPGGRRYQPILAEFDRMAAQGVRFRVIHSDLPSRRFRDTLERFPALTGSALELQICPRAHWKMIIVDGTFAYLGSANFTGAGLGARSARRRNLELGVASREPTFVRHLATLFDAFWIGGHCRDCSFRSECPDPIADT